MKKRFLMMLPLIALTTSCGDDPMAAVRQNLPSDMEKVPMALEDDKDAALEILEDTLTGLVNFQDNKAVYHLSLNTAISMKETDMSASSSMKGDLYFGYEVEFERAREHRNVEDPTEENPTSKFFLKLENFTVNLNMKLPKEVAAELPIPERFAINNMNLYVYGEETESGAMVYADLSDYVVQDYARTVLLLNGFEEKVSRKELPSVDQILDDFLGEKDEETGYRPGKVKINLSDLLKDIDDMLADQATVDDPYERMPNEMIEKPISYFLLMGKSMIDSYADNVLSVIAQVATVSSPIIGVKYEEVTGEGEMAALLESAVVVNTSSSQVASALGVSESYIPVHGYLGLMVRVGTETGAEMDALEEITLGANVSVTAEEMTASINGKISLSASYNEQAELVAVGEQEAADYNNIREAIDYYFLGA